MGFSNIQLKISFALRFLDVIMNNVGNNKNTITITSTSTFTIPISVNVKAKYLNIFDRITRGSINNSL